MPLYVRACVHVWYGLTNVSFPFCYDLLFIVTVRNVVRGVTSLEGGGYKMRTGEGRAATGSSLII